MAIHTMREETPGSISSVLEELNQGRIFEGEPLTGASADETGKPPTEPVDEEVILGGHPAEETEEAEESSEPDKTLKYKDQEEAEAAVLQTNQAVAELSRELREVKDLTFQVLAPPGQGERESPTEAPLVESPVEFNKRRRREVLDEIEELNFDNDNYKGKVADAQARADMDIQKHYQDIQAVDERIKREHSEGIRAVIGQAEKAMKEAGLDASPEADDSVLFWALTQTAPREKDGVPLSVDEQIEWTVNKTKGYTTKALEAYKTEKAEAARSGTLGSVVEAVTESRRM